MYYYCVHCLECGRMDLAFWIQLLSAYFISMRQFNVFYYVLVILLTDHSSKHNARRRAPYCLQHAVPFLGWPSLYSHTTESWKNFLDTHTLHWFSKRSAQHAPADVRSVYEVYHCRTLPVMGRDLGQTGHIIHFRSGVSCMQYCLRTRQLHRSPTNVFSCYGQIYTDKVCWVSACDAALMWKNILKAPRECQHSTFNRSIDGFSLSRSLGASLSPAVASFNK